MKPHKARRPVLENPSRERKYPLTRLCTSTR
jgi:hypothetical protein